MSKLIPKHQTPSQPLVLQNDNTELEVNKPTLEEFITSKIQEKKQQAIRKSYERTKPTVPYITMQLDKKVRDNYQELAEYTKQEIDQLQSILSSYNSAEVPYETHYPSDKNYDQISQRLENLQQNFKSYTQLSKNQLEGASCLYTATDNYGKQYRCSGNQTFKANPKNFGFTQIPNSQLQPGDIVQTVPFDIPTHGMLFVKYSDQGYPLYNYSNGESNENAIQKERHFPAKKTLTYTFTGLPSDSAQWKKEYEEIYGYKKGGQLIPKHQTPSQPLVLQNDNTRVKQQIEPEKVKVDWSKYTDEEVIKVLQDRINKANQQEQERIKNSHSERMFITQYGSKDDITPDQAREYLNSDRIPVLHRYETMIGRGLSGADPIGEFVVGNAVLGTPLKLIGKGLLYGTGKYLPKTKLGNWSRAKIISNELNKPISQEALNKINKIFRTSEWNEFLMTKNGYNYYRLGTPITNGDEMTFLSHTTPWEEFIPKPNTEVPAYAELGPKILYEFPHKTFGTLKASGNKPGAFGDVNVRRYGLQHLFYGNYASGERGLVRNMSSKNYMRAKQAGLDVDEFKIGLKKRPLVDGHYDQNPIYEDIYNGYQTQIKADDFLKAVKTKPHMTYEYTDNGIQKILWNP